jgi:hypothetical protein
MALDLDGTDDLVELGKFDVTGQVTLGGVNPSPVSQSHALFLE